MTVDHSGLLGQVRDLQEELAIIRKSVQLLRQVNQSSDAAEDAKAEAPKPKRRGRPPKAAKPVGMPPKPQGRGRLRKNLPKKPTRHRGRPRQSKM